MFYLVSVLYLAIVKQIFQEHNYLGNFFFFKSNLSEVTSS